MSAIRRLLTHLPAPVKRAAWRAGRALGSFPQKVRGGPAEGWRIVVPLDRRGSYAGAAHEPHVLRALESSLGPGASVLDVGGHLGYFALQLSALVGPEGRVWTFEPWPRHASRLRRTAELNDLERLTVVELALARLPGAAPFFEPPNEAMVRRLPAGLERSTTDVPATTLDLWIEERELERLDLVKIDVEGAELDVLMGAPKTLERLRPTIVCEIHTSAWETYTPRELIDFLRERNYEVELIRHPRGTRPLAEILQRIETRPPSPYVRTFHILARHRDSGGP